MFHGKYPCKETLWEIQAQRDQTIGPWAWLPVTEIASRKVCKFAIPDIHDQRSTFSPSPRIYYLFTYCRKDQIVSYSGATRWTFVSLHHWIEPLMNFLKIAMANRARKWKNKKFLCKSKESSSDPGRRWEHESPWYIVSQLYLSVKHANYANRLRSWKKNRIEICLYCLLHRSASMVFIFLNRPLDGDSIHVIAPFTLFFCIETNNLNLCGRCPKLWRFETSGTQMKKLIMAWAWNRCPDIAQASGVWTRAANEIPSPIVLGPKSDGRKLWRPLSLSRRPSSGHPKLYWKKRRRAGGNQKGMEGGDKPLRFKDKPWCWWLQNPPQGLGG